MKKIINSIVKYLTICINKSFREEKIPQILKVSRISPLFKSLDRTNPINWRPLAQLLTWSKIFEKCLMTQVIENCDRQEIIDPNQFGFRSSHSTVHPLLLIKNFIESELKQKKYVAIIAVDYEKAFDCVSTNGPLQQKIKYYTKSDKITNWIDSFYKNRTQFTIWNNTNSEIIKNHEISIVQGSNLGPKNFNFYINDLPKASKLLTILFADDSTFLASSKSPDLLNKFVNDELRNIKDYSDANKISYSQKKTTYMICTPKYKEKVKFDIKMGNSKINECEEITLLGVIIDNKLKFTSHFNKVYDKVKNGLNGLIMVKNILDYRAKLNIFHSLIQSHLDYCAMIWLPNLNNKQLNMLKVVQKKAIRIVCNAKYNSHTGGLFQDNRITKVENIFERDSLIMIFKYQDRNLPKAILELFDTNLHDDNFLTRKYTSWVLRPKKGLQNGDMMYDVIDCWNRIGMNVRELNNLQDFKSKIKKLQNNYIKCTKMNCYSCQST